MQAVTSVLIAEDELLIAEALRRELEQQFRVVAVVANGMEAIETVAKDRPDVALLDISMAVMNGFEAAEQIATIAPDVKVIMVTSHAEPAYVEEAFRRGAKGYMLKGRLSELYQAIQAVLQGRTYKPDLPSLPSSY